MEPALLDLLERQHRQAERILHQLSKATSVHKQQPLVDKLRNAMTEHMRIEEADVYPLLERFALELEVEAEIEHDLARKGLQQLSDMVGRPGFGAVVAMVQAGIGHHVEEEEKQIFPRLRSAPAGASLDEEQLDVRAIAKKRKRTAKSAKSQEELIRTTTHNPTIA